MIRVTDLTKYYGKQLAVDGLSFSVGQGEIVGFLGPNAAGKTTTMRIITGYLTPTRGEVWVAGYNMMSHSLDGRREIGYMPEIVPLYIDMTTRAYLEFVAGLRGLDRKKSRSRIEEVVAMCHLEDVIDVILGRLSKGFKQRVGLAQAIVHDPKVLVLDEPTIGIDPIQVAQTRQLIKELGTARTILISSHILPEVSMLCERVIILNQGRIVAEDRIENLSTLLKGANRIRLKVQGSPEKVTDCLRRIDSIQKVTYESPYHLVEFPADREPRNDITQAIVQSGWTLLAMEAVEMSLEEIFLELTAARTPGQ